MGLWEIVSGFDYEAVLKHYVAPGAVIAALGYCVRLYIKHHFDKSIELFKSEIREDTDKAVAAHKGRLDRSLITHKANLDAGIEEYRAQLKKEADEHQSNVNHELQLIKDQRSVMFSRLHEKQANVISELFALALIVREKLKDFNTCLVTDKFSNSDKDSSGEILKEIYVASDEFMKCFTANSIYFNGDISDIVKYIYDFNFQVCVDGHVKKAFLDEFKRCTAVQEVMHREQILDKYDEILNKLKEEFRKLLGSN